MTLSPRLRAVADLVPAEGTVVDIGSDHGRLARALAANGRSVIASEVSEPTLATLRIALGPSSPVETRLSDGFAAFAPGEAEIAVIAGMGGVTIDGILDRAGRALPPGATVVLQPQSRVPRVRRGLEHRGWPIDDERLVRDGGRYYWILRARVAEVESREPRGEEDPYTVARWAVGEFVGRTPNAVYADWLGAERTRINQCLLRMARAEGGRDRQTYQVYRDILSHEIAHQRRGLSPFSHREAR